MKKRLLIFTVILTLLCGTLLAYQALGDSRRGCTVTISREEYDRLAQYAKLDEVLQYIQAYYYQEPDTDAMMDMAVQGLRRLLKHGFTKSSKVEKAKETYRQKSSTTLTWVAENAIGEEDILEKSTGEVYFQFKSWCETEGIEKVPKQLNFTEEIKKEFGVVTGTARRDQKTGKVSRFFEKA